MYQKTARLFIGKGMELESQEGTTQGDNITMTHSAIGIKPLMERFEGEKILQEWFADDAACLGELLPFKKWEDQIKDFRPKYGYFPKASKCWLISKSEGIPTEAKTIFQKHRNKHHSNRTETFGSRYRSNRIL